MNTAPVCRKESVRPDDALAVRGAAWSGVGRAAKRWSATLSNEDREDLVQEALVRLWLRYPERWESGPPALVRRIALNLTVDHLRRRSTQKRGGGRLISLEAAGGMPERTLLVDEQLVRGQSVASRLRECRQLLSRKQAKVFDLVYVCGLSSREAGAVLGLRWDAIDTMVARVRRVLSKRGIVLARRVPSENVLWA